MADRYSVGSGQYTSTTVWSDTSGGTTGFSVPTSADNVFIDANTGVIQCVSGGSCANLTYSKAGGLAFGNSTASILIYGNLVLNTNLTASGSSRSVQLRGSGTVQSNGYTITSEVSSSYPTVYTGSTYTLLDDMTWITTGGQNGVYLLGTLNCGSNTLSSNGGVSCGTGGVINSTGVINICNTSLAASLLTTVLSASSSLSSATINHGGYRGLTSNTTIGTLNITKTADVAGTFTLGTVTNLTITKARCAFAQNFTATNLTATGTEMERANIYSSTTSNITITSTTRSINYVICRNISAGVPWDLSSADASDGGANTNITFPTARNCYWVAQTGGDWFSSGSWSNATFPSSPSQTFIPRTQDEGIFDMNSITQGGSVVNINAASGFISSINTTGLLNSPTFTAASCFFYGDISLSGFGSVNISGACSWFGRKSSNLYLKNSTLASLTIQPASTSYTLQLQDSGTITALTLAAGSFNSGTGTLNINTFTSTTTTAHSIGNLAGGIFIVAGDSFANSVSNSDFGLGFAGTLRFNNTTASDTTFRLALLSGANRTINILDLESQTSKLILDFSSASAGQTLTINTLKLAASSRISYTKSTNTVQFIVSKVINSAGSGTKASIVFAGTGSEQLQMYIPSATVATGGHLDLGYCDLTNVIATTDPNTNYCAGTLVNSPNILNQICSYAGVARVFGVLRSKIYSINGVLFNSILN